MDDLAYTVDEFCFAHRMCRATFYNLQKRGAGPKIMKVGGRTRISRTAVDEWHRKMEAEASQASAAA